MRGDCDLPALLASPGPLRPRVERALDAVCRELEWAAASLWVPIGESSTLGWAVGVPDTEARATGKGLMLGAEDGVVGRAWKSGTPEWIEDVMAHDAFLRMEAFAELGLRSALCVPLRDGPRVVGVLDLASRDRRAPDPAHLERLDRLTRILAPAVAAGIEELRPRSTQRASQALAPPASRDSPHELPRRLTDFADAERRRLAVELHDSIGQGLATLKLSLARIQSTAAARGVDLRGPLETVDQLVSELKTLTFDLHPAMLDDLGLLPALQAFAEDFHRRTGVRVTVAERGTASRLGPVARRHLFRSVKELVTNAARHGLAAEIVVVVGWRSSGLRVVVDDDGQGFDGAAPARGVGLVSVRERMTSLGGRLELHSEPGAGARAVLSVPLTADEPDPEHRS